MKPQKNDPCNACKLWDDATGCEDYNSSAMIAFGYCGKRVPKEATFNVQPLEVTQYDDKKIIEILELKKLQARLMVAKLKETLEAKIKDLRILRSQASSDETAEAIGDTIKDMQLNIEIIDDTFASMD